MLSPLEQASLQRTILSHSLGMTEIRDIAERKSYYAKDDSEFRERISKLLERDPYVGINPRSTENGSSASIDWLTCLVIDIDPVRERGSASTEIQHEAALEV